MFQSLLGAERGVVRRQARSLDCLLPVGCFHLHWAAPGLSFLPPYPVVPIPVWAGQSHPPSKGLLLMGQDAHFLPLGIAQNWSPLTAFLVFHYLLEPRAQKTIHYACPAEGLSPVTQCTRSPTGGVYYVPLRVTSVSHHIAQGGGDWV